MRGIKAMREQCLSKANGNVKEANRMLVDIFKAGLKDKTLEAKNVSYKALFEGLVDLSNVDVNDARQVAEAVASSSFSTITTMITHDIIIEPYSVQTNQVMELVTEGTAKSTLPELVKGMTALGGVRRRLETQAYEETDFEEKRVEVSKSDFGRIISLTMEDIYNDASDDIRDRANTIGEDAGQHMEQMIMETLEVLPRTAFGESASRAFVYNGTAFTQGNFYNTDHSAIAGLDFQVNANTSTGGLTITGLTNAYLNFSKLKDEKGKLITIDPKVIVINKQNELTLANVLMTERVLGSNNNDLNQFGPRGRVSVKMITSNFLATTANLGYMGDPKRSLLWLWVQKPKTITAPANDELAFSRQIVWRARFNYYGGIGHRDYRYINRITA